MKKEFWVAMLPFYLLVGIVFLGVAKLGSEAVTHVVSLQPPPRVTTVIIDAGHGGVDGGATSCTGVLESNINLAIALKLDDLFRFLGYETKMIRRTDISVYTEGESIAAKKVSDLKERLRIANSTENAVYISIHQNTFPDARYGGPQVFYAENVPSKNLATQMQNSLVQALSPSSKRQSKQGRGIYLLEHMQCTGILIECGFLSNPEEEARLRQDSYQRQLCCVIAATVGTYLSNT